MTRVVTKSRVGADGVLHLELPLGTPEAGREVQVTVESLPPPMTQEEWRAWVYRTAGSVTDPGFERPPQGDYEVRESLS